jgi:myosin heavy subunit
MDTLGFSSSDKTSVWKILAGILHLGNITFATSGNKTTVSNTPGIEISQKFLIKSIANCCFLAGSWPHNIG